ncbi:tetratricopeptide repeat-containing response regulator [Photobacterium sp. 1_MG-2023]|uniref:tetratricopeptide repeat-containing response regulator n=1 Tax=Photobacterium sp. 1_MG-2023 TaxID=3062646 RepID=UPI0026E33E7A|nr:tetratricopeptide repeat-containing response regulator [Photobacterium sp. 1_MG-2023]MDO6706040.1 response regulator [Photobacterium sp. 1_MG-2023]
MLLCHFSFLIIDDSHIAISLMRSMLTNAGVPNAKIQTTSDSLKALRMLRTNTYDVVLCDYNMQHHIDGGLIFDEIKHNHLLPPSSVFICVTGDNSQQVVTHFLELEPDDYLIKPFRMNDFISRIEYVLARKIALNTLLTAVEEKRYETALDCGETLLSQYPKYKGYLSRIHGDCLLRLQRHQEAETFYKQAMQETQHIWPMVGFGNALQGSGKLKQAEEVFQEILARHPNHPKVRQCLANCLIRKEELPEALQQFLLLHKINPANPIRELIIANLYAAQQQHEKAASCYFRYTEKVKDTSQYSLGIDVNMSVSMLLASIYLKAPKQQIKLVDDARTALIRLNQKTTKDDKQLARHPSLLVGMAILACLRGEIQNCYSIANQIESDQEDISDFYTALNLARMYGFCGMPDMYESAMVKARQICGEAQDEGLMLSQTELLNGFQDEIYQRLRLGGALVKQAQQYRQENLANKALKKAYRAFFIVPFHHELCFLILELTGLATPSWLQHDEVMAILKSCYWVYCNDKRPTEQQKSRALDFYRLALIRVD